MIPAFLISAGNLWVPYFLGETTHIQAWLVKKYSTRNNSRCNNKFKVFRQNADQNVSTLWAHVFLVVLPTCHVFKVIHLSRKLLRCPFHFILSPHPVSKHLLILQLFCGRTNTPSVGTCLQLDFTIIFVWHHLIFQLEAVSSLWLATCC